MSLNKVGGVLSAGLTGINSPVTQVEYLVVAGGGGGGGNKGGGGGAGGVLQATGYPVSMGTSLTITIGAGGAVDANGSNTVFGNITAVGGGYGGNDFISRNGNSGGSGGGSCRDGTAGFGTAGQGNAGGVGFNGAPYNGGGGGGAGSIGRTPLSGYGSSSPAGQGGAGIISNITGAQLQYAGGGGGGSYQGYGNIGGTNNAGRGADDYVQFSTAVLASSATPNSGSGGGAGGFDGAAGTGGSGVVVIRYPSYMALASSTTGSPETYIAGNWRVYRWKSSGTITF